MTVSDTHTTDTPPNPAVVQEIQKRQRKGTLACAVAFDIVGKIGFTPAEIGRTADLISVRLVKCQLGLFGYKPQKKIVEPHLPEDPALIDAIRNGLADGRLPCKTAWGIAVQFGVSKMAVSSACEALGIKIKPCQLGAF